MNYYPRDELKKEKNKKEVVRFLKSKVLPPIHRPTGKIKKEKGEKNSKHTPKRSKASKQS